jgi:hypothetical protein
MVGNLMFCKQVTLKEELEIFLEDGDPQSSIPFWIWLLENPQSPISLPGKIDLFNHDCLHVLFGLGKSPEDEAVILGITFGGEPKFNRFHLLIFKFFSRFIYPGVFKFNKHHLKILDQAYLYARNQKFPNFSQIEFRQKIYQNTSLDTLRKLLKIKLEEVKNLKILDRQQSQKSNAIEDCEGKIALLNASKVPVKLCSKSMAA